ncbi:hypothetical protein NCS52_00430200 [Fusarium sp. LHS14.1]|nr:hypothetical protein NCS52_00430200 [Fusarium sp. LHS14.1]
MSFVASPDQCMFFACGGPKPLRFYREMISVEFLTTEEFVRSVLPPGFEPVDKPVGNISISAWASNRYGSFDLGMVSLQCKHKGVVGGWMLTIVIDQDMGAFYGREAWGEVKKCGSSQLFRNGYTRSGFTKRGDVKLFELEGRIRERGRWRDCIRKSVEVHCINSN